MAEIKTGIDHSAEVQQTPEAIDAFWQQVNLQGSSVNSADFVKKFRKLSPDQQLAVRDRLQAIVADDSDESGRMLSVNIGIKIDNGQPLTPREQKFANADKLLSNSEFQEALRKGKETPLRKQIGNFLNEQFSRIGRVKNAALDGGKNMLKSAWKNLKNGWQKLRGVGEAVSRVPGAVIDKVVSKIGPETPESRDNKLAEAVVKLHERYQSVSSETELFVEDPDLARDMADVEALLASLDEILVKLVEKRAQLGDRINLSDADKEISAEIDALQAEYDSKIVQADGILKRLEGPTKREKIVSAVENFGRRTFSKEGRLEGKAEKLRQKEAKAIASKKEADEQINEIVSHLADLRAELQSTTSPESAESRKVLNEQIQALEVKLESTKRKMDEFDHKAVINGFDAEITEQQRKVEELKKKKNDPEALEELAKVMRIIRSFEQARDSHIEKFGGDPTENGRERFAKAVRKGFAETGHMAVWSAKELLKDKEEQAFWLILQVLAGAAGGAPLLLGVSGVTLLREAVRAGVIPGEKIPVLKRFLSAQGSADVYQNIAGQGPKEFLQELAESLPEDPEDLNAYQKGFRKVMRFMGGALSIVGTTLVWADKKILGVMNQGTEKRGVGYARDLTSVLEGMTIENAQSRFTEQLQKRFNVNAFQDMVNEGNYVVVEEEIADMEQMLRDIANIRAQGGAIAGGEAFGLRTAKFDQRMFAPDVLDAWENALMDILISVAGSLSNIESESLRSRIGSLPKENSDEAMLYRQKINEKAQQSRKMLALSARVIRVLWQTSGIHVLSDALLGQSTEIAHSNTTETNSPETPPVVVPVEPPVETPPVVAPVEPPVETPPVVPPVQPPSEQAYTPQPAPEANFIPTTDTHGGYNPDIINHSPTESPTINLNADGNAFWMERNLDLKASDASHFAQEALQQLGVTEHFNPLINVASRVMTDLGRTLTESEMQSVVDAFNGVDGIPADVVAAAQAIARGSDPANYTANLDIISNYAEAQ